MSGRGGGLDAGDWDLGCWSRHDWALFSRNPRINVNAD